MHIVNVACNHLAIYASPPLPCRTQMDIQNISFEVDAIKGQYTQNLMRQVRGCCSTAGGKGGTSHALVLQYESLHCTSIGHSQRCRRCTFLGCSQCTVPACCLPACLCAW